MLIAPAMTLLPLRLSFFLRGVPMLFGTSGAERVLRGLGPRENRGREPYEERFRSVISPARREVGAGRGPRRAGP